MPSLDHALPAYQQIARHYAEQIARGELAPGDKLPSERELMDAWSVSKATANRVTAALKAEGLAESRVGAGTLVAPQSGPAGIGTVDMFRRMRHDGQIRLPGEYSVRTTGRAAGSDVPRQIVEALSGTTQSEFVWRRRVIHRNDVPYSVAVSWFLPAVIGQSAGLIERLLEDAPITEGTPRFIAAELGVDLMNASDHLSAVAVDTRLSEDLRVAPASPALYLVSTIYADKWGAIEAGEYWYGQRAGVNYRYEV